MSDTAEPFAGHPGMTIRTYRVNRDTGQTEDISDTVTVPPVAPPLLAPLEFGACSCPQCMPGARR